MVKYFIPIIILILFIGCGNSFEYWDYDFDDGLDYLESIEDVFYFCINEIRYSKINEGPWQLPHETLERGAGDCEDLTLLFVYLVYKYCGENLYCIRLTSRTTPEIEHFIAWDGKFYYDPSARQIYKYEIVHLSWTINETYNYGRAMFLALIW